MEFAYQESNSFLDVKFIDDLGRLVVPTTLYYSIIDYDTETIIRAENSVAIVPITSTHTIEIVPADNIIIDTNKTEENHTVKVRFTYAGVGGSKTGIGRYEYQVINTNVIP